MTGGPRAASLPSSWSATSGVREGRNGRRVVRATYCTAGGSTRASAPIWSWGSAHGYPLAASDLAAAGDAKKAYAAFRGTWRFVSVEVEGQKVPEADLKGSRLILRGRDFEVKEGALTYGGTFELNLDARPTPYGVSFTGMACSEPKLLALAYAFEQATKRRVPPPAVP